jgi:hypothetical protein
MEMEKAFSQYGKGECTADSFFPNRLSERIRGAESFLFQESAMG